MEKLVGWISTLAPFLNSYPAWVKGAFAVWVALGAVLLIGLVLARTEVAEQPPSAGAEQPEGSTAVAEPPEAEEDELWLVVERLEFFSARPGAQVQVRATVNGTEYLYPSREGVEWLEVGPSMSSQRFRLPPPTARYEVSFTAEVRVPMSDADTWVTGQLTSVDQDILNVPVDLPHSGRFVLHTFDPVHMSRSANATAEVVYRVTADPS